MEGERITRPLFGRDGPLSKLQIYDMIDASRPGAVFQKFVINFHPVKEDTRKDLNLWEITEKPLRRSKRNLVTAFRLSPPSMMTTRCFGISTGFSLLKAGFQKKNSKNQRLVEDRISGSMAPTPSP
jgi:hypothetical protein